MLGNFLYAIIVSMGVASLFAVILGVIYVVYDYIVINDNKSSDNKNEVNVTTCNQVSGLFLNVNSDLESILCVLTMINENRGYASFDELYNILKVFNYESTGCCDSILIIDTLKLLLRSSRFTNAKDLYDHICSEYINPVNENRPNILIYHIGIAIFSNVEM